MRWQSTRSLLAVTLLASLAACGGRAFREPVVILHGVELAGLGLRGGTLSVNVEVTNPNRYTLSANQIRYQLAIADAQSPRDTVWLNLATGTYDERVSVGGGQTAFVQVPVEFTYSGLGGAAASLLRAGTFNYRATGSVAVGTPLGSYDVPFRRGGTVTLLGAR